MLNCCDYVTLTGCHMSLNIHFGTVAGNVCSAVDVSDPGSQHYLFSENEFVDRKRGLSLLAYIIESAEDVHLYCREQYVEVFVNYLISCMYDVLIDTGVQIEFADVNVLSNPKVLQSLRRIGVSG